MCIQLCNYVCMVRCVLVSVSEVTNHMFEKGVLSDILAFLNQQRDGSVFQDWLGGCWGAKPPRQDGLDVCNQLCNFVVRCAVRCDASWLVRRCALRSSVLTHFVFC